MTVVKEIVAVFLVYLPVKTIDKLSRYISVQNFISNLDRLKKSRRLSDARMRQ